MPKTFLYHAQASILGGFITRPETRTVDTVAGVTLPFTGGHQRADASKPGQAYTYDLPLITIAGATAEVSGSQNGGVYNTTITTTINGLVIKDIENNETIISADAMGMTITTRHPGAVCEATVQINSYFTNLVIKGTPVTIVPDTWLNSAQTYEDFDKKYGSNPHVSHGNRPGKMRCSLIKQLTHPNANPPTDQQSLYVPNFGTIYLGEVYLADSRRQVSLMRLEMGSPVAGMLTLGGGDGNGTPFP